MDELQSKAFEYFGALAFCILGLSFALAWVTRKWVAAMEKIEAMHRERLEAERENSRTGEAMRDVMQANTDALRSAVDVMPASRGGRE